MDSFRINNIQVEKANAMMKHRQLKKVANWFRLIEICVILIVISKFSSQLPEAVKNSGGYFKDLSGFLLSSRFVFVLGNLIVITLFAKSGQFSSQNTENEIIKQFTEVENRGKQRSQLVVSEKGVTCKASKSYKRSQSENLRRVSCGKSCKELRRMETEKFNGGGEIVVKNSNSNLNLKSKSKSKSGYPEDEMSSEEFRRKVEAFIARQQKFRREEEYSVIKTQLDLTSI